MFSNNLALGLFFLYFVLMSGECGELMNCGLQRYINNSVFIKHLMIFLSIFIFTFILNWYTIENIIELKLPDKLFSTVNVENFDDKKQKDKPKPKKLFGRFNYLFKSFYYSIAIYLFFILSTKNAGSYAFFFLIGMVIIVFGTIFVRTINPEISKTVGNNGIFTFITPSQMVALQQKYKENNKDVVYITIIQNIMTVFAIVLFSVLFVGAYKYYLKQSSEHSENWSWLKFWFGTNKCANLN